MFNYALPCKNRTFWIDFPSIMKLIDNDQIDKVRQLFGGEN